MIFFTSPLVGLGSGLLRCLFIFDFYKAVLKLPSTSTAESFDCDIRLRLFHMFVNYRLGSFRKVSGSFSYGYIFGFCFSIFMFND